MSKTELEAFIRGLHARPMIASVKEAKHIEIALAYREKLGGVFLLTGHIGVVRNYVELYKSHRLPVFLHLEKIGGLSTDYYGLDYLAKTVKPDGIVTTKTNVVKTAKKMGLIAIQRFFLIDTEGLDNIANSLSNAEPDIVEVMPARIPEALRRVQALTPLPVVAGGLLFDRDQALECLGNGATAVSSSKPELWRHTFK